MPKSRLDFPYEVPFTDDRLGITETMEDEDAEMMNTVTSFKANASIDEGVSGRKKIDTLFENYMETDVESPRNEYAPMQINKYENPHRGY